MADTYFLSRSVRRHFLTAVADTTAALKGEGFGILTDIDVQATMKEKLDAQVPPYRILGACNPGLALEALQVEEKLGVLLPCNVIVRDAGAGTVEVAAVNPVASLGRVGNPKLTAVAAEVKARLERALDAMVTTEATRG